MEGIHKREGNSRARLMSDASFRGVVKGWRVCPNGAFSAASETEVGPSTSPTRVSP